MAAMKAVAGDTNTEGQYGNVFRKIAGILSKSVRRAAQVFTLTASGEYRVLK
jgi:hypothetical protein